jgi:hypothetical protein
VQAGGQEQADVKRSPSGAGFQQPIHQGIVACSRRIQPFGQDLKEAGIKGRVAGSEFLL